jgi:hypothetical protein
VANRKIIKDTLGSEANYVGTNAYGVRRYAKTQESGTQSWCDVRNGVIQNGGINEIPIDNWEERGFTK